MTPLALRARFPNIQKEIRRSLRTYNLSVARRYAAKLYMQTTIDFDNALNNLDTIEEAVKRIPALLKFATKFPAAETDYLQNVVDTILADHKSLLEQRFLEDITSNERKHLTLIYSLMMGIQSFDFTKQEEIDHAPILSKKITEEINQLVIKVSRSINGKSVGLIPTVATRSISFTPQSGDEPLNATRFTSATHQNIPATQNSFLSVSGEFINERLSGNNWTPKTHQSYVSTFKLFTDILGDIPVADIGPTVAREFKAQIQRLPKNHSKDSTYRNLTVKNILKLDIPSDKRLSTESINKHLNRVSSLLDWCLQQSYIDKNYLAKMKIRTSKASIDSRKPFSIEDLNKLFSDPIYTKGKMSKEYYFWLPLIALYTGARIQEICQLELTDIYKIDDVLVININNNSDSKRLKNTNSERIIPVHDTLIDIGFNRYISSLKKRKEAVLFPELTKNTKDREGQSQPASKWFARFKTKHGFNTDGVKAFHSFRHTFIDELKIQGVAEHITASLAGHSHDNITYGTYGAKNAATALKEDLQKLQFDGFNVSEIKWLKN